MQLHVLQRQRADRDQWFILEEGSAAGAAQGIFSLKEQKTDECSALRLLLCVSLSNMLHERGYSQSLF